MPARGFLAADARAAATPEGAAAAPDCRRGIDAASVLSVGQPRGREEILLGADAAEQLERLLQLHVVVEAHALRSRVAEGEVRDAALQVAVDGRRRAIVELPLDRHPRGGDAAEQLVAPGRLDGEAGL